MKHELLLDLSIDLHETKKARRLGVTAAPVTSEAALAAIQSVGPVDTMDVRKALCGDETFRAKVADHYGVKAPAKTGKKDGGK